MKGFAEATYNMVELWISWICLYNTYKFMKLYQLGCQVIWHF